MDNDNGTYFIKHSGKEPRGYSIERKMKNKPNASSQDLISAKDIIDPIV